MEQGKRQVEQPVSKIELSPCALREALKMIRSQFSWSYRNMLIQPENSFEIDIWWKRMNFYAEQEKSLKDDLKNKELDKASSNVEAKMRAKNAPTNSQGNKSKHDYTINSTR